MTGTTDGRSHGGGSRQGRRRIRQPVPRTRRVEFTLTGEEYAVVIAAAARAGLARRAYAAHAALAAAASGRLIGDEESLGQMLIELMRAAGLVRRIAANLNQAAAKLNA
ncbi:MAG: plasmid mobilization protein, partial [Streptosporangiaceae bacterium]